MKAIDNQRFSNVKLNFNEGLNIQFVPVYAVYIDANYYVGNFYWMRSLLTPYLGA